MAAKPVPLSRAGARVHVSFEFFPPKTAEMEANYGRRRPGSSR